MKPRLWKMYGVWWCGSYYADDYWRIADAGSVCHPYAAEAYKLWKDNQ